MSTYLAYENACEGGDRMARVPKVIYLMILLTLLIALTGCELRRDSSELADPAPVSDLPPTLAPLGSETFGAEATAVPTIIAVQPTATLTNLGEGQTAADPAEPTVPTSEAVDLSGPVVDNTTVEGVSAAEVAAQPVDETAAAETIPADAMAETAATEEQAIIADATTAADLPIGGPVAANPPVSQTGGAYEAATYDGGSYTVQPGDTLFSVAQRYGTTVEALVYANNLNSDVIYIGQVLTVSGDDGGNYAAPAYPQPNVDPTQGYGPGGAGSYHVVAPGETLYSIALQYNSSIRAIAETNNIASPFTIRIGQQLLVPTSNAPYAGPPQVEAYGAAPGNFPAPGNGYQPAPGNGSAHVVAPGETLYSIALQYGTSVDAIAGLNGIPYPYTIGIGQPLLLPPPGAYAGPPPPAPAEGYYAQQPPQGYQPQVPAGGYYQQPPQGYPAQPPADTYAPAPGDVYGNTIGTHTVAPGETLFSIAQQYGTSAEALAGANGLSNPNQLFVGQVLYLP
jgi:LysM repeat protein